MNSKTRSCLCRWGKRATTTRSSTAPSDLLGKTSLRELIRLMAHAQGVVCPVTFLMHLAAAVPKLENKPARRAGVVIAGGRESPHWEAYPWHQFIHTVGALPCCREGGCWRSRTLPLGDGDGKDDPSQLCVDVVDGLPRCMDMIGAAEVIDRVRRYLDGGAVPRLSHEELEAARESRVPSQLERFTT